MPEASAAEPLPRLVASDFYGYLRPSQCGLRVWLREQDAEEAPLGVFAATLMRLGIEHERRHLERFRRHVDIGTLPREQQAAATVELVAARERVIYQGRLEAQTTLAGREVEIVGLPDFMLPARSGYAIRDSKLNRRVGPSSLHVALQVELYGWLYEQTFGDAPVALQVHAGGGEIFDVPYEDGGKRALETLGRILELRMVEGEPEEYVGVSKCADCGFHGRCWPMAVKRRDIGLLPGVDRGLIEELHATGTDTLDELLADWDVERLAALERPTRRGPAPVGERSVRILTSARALAENRSILIAPGSLNAAIPDHETYVMFDLEGMPPRHDELEKIYIWGMQCFGARPGEFRAAVAGFGAGGDREGWESFLAEAATIFAEHGDLPFVHWASYEAVKIRLYVERYGDRNGVAARVLGNLVDLLPITREAVAVPLSGYGLKAIETLTGYERSLEEFGGDWSMARYIEAVESDDAVARAAIIDQILAYNREDLEATWAVLEWLRRLQAAAESGSA